MKLQVFFALENSNLGKLDCLKSFYMTCVLTVLLAKEIYRSDSKSYSRVAPTRFDRML